MGRVAFRCPCGFRLENIPQDVLDQVPRCLGCGRPRGASPGRVRAPSTLDVRDLR